jgi:hypothetical protein
MDGFNRPIPAVLELDLSRHLSEVGFALFLPQAHPLQDQQGEFVRRKPRNQMKRMWLFARCGVIGLRLDDVTRCLGIGT